MIQKHKQNLYNVNVKCNFQGKKCNSNQMWNNARCRCDYKYLQEHRVCKRYIFGILLMYL